MERNNRPIQLGIAFGYIDQIPTDRVIDGLLFSRLLNSLVQKCTYEENTICGFIKTMNNPLTYEKNNIIKITLFNSSVSASNQYNIKIPEQGIKSDDANDQLQTMANDSDIIFYLGHSRKGGGPDFSPPRLTKDNKVDYEFYKTHHPGLEHLNNILPDSKVKLFGVYSCDSEKNFSAYLKNNFSDINFILTGESTIPSDAFKIMSADLRKLLTGQCVTTY